MIYLYACRLNPGSAWKIQISDPNPGTQPKNRLGSRLRVGTQDWLTGHVLLCNCRDHCNLNQQTVGEMLQLAKNYDKVGTVPYWYRYCRSNPSISQFITEVLRSRYPYGSSSQNRGFRCRGAGMVGVYLHWGPACLFIKKLIRVRITWALFNERVALRIRSTFDRIRILPINEY